MIIGVMAGGDPKNAALHRGEAEEVGRVVASGGHDLLTGGGRGLMLVVGRAFLDTKDRRGRLIGVIRALGTKHLSGEWHDKTGACHAVQKSPPPASREWIANADNGLSELKICTHLPFSAELGKHDLSRNHINVLTSEKIVVLPGGKGTFTELQLAHEYGRPICLYVGKSGKVGGKTLKQLREEYSGVHSAQNTKELAKWLKA